MTNHTQRTDHLILIQFYAEWCAPCRAMMPVIASLKEKQYDWLEIQQINVDHDAKMTTQYNIRSIPTIVAVKNDREVWRNTGILTEKSITEQLSPLK
ncbi:thioredoxin family protein [Chitinophaga sp. G-6-1-13]|uniref:Thioredoxin family protein n=1 Tax=Chitinophaga fulva TaxID=2728842 RepID=A0A848GSI2_9BACT|nr:thioredoxin family protein [Chitinophaga fulva]NML41344.1 thioredoxin family protein [Chitinophaga fulva]